MHRRRTLAKPGFGVRAHARNQFGRRVLHGDIERRLRLIFQHQLQVLRDVFAAEFGCDLETEIDTGGDAAAGNAVAVDHDALVDRNRPEGSKLIAHQPMAGRLVSVDQPCGAEDQAAGANRRDVPRRSTLVANERNHLVIVHGGDLPRTAADAEHIQIRTVGECRGRQQRQADIADHRLDALPKQMNPNVRQAGKDLERPGDVQLGHPGIVQNSDLDPLAGHAPLRL